jgi:hypothetical protein
MAEHHDLCQCAACFYAEPQSAEERIASLESELSTERDARRRAELEAAQLRASGKVLVEANTRHFNHALAAEQSLNALREAANGRLRKGHNDTCAAVLTSEKYECTCGHDALEQALAAIGKGSDG